jgi:hypothetical protein
MKKYFKTYNTKTIIDVPEEFEYILFDEDLTVWVYIEKPVIGQGRFAWSNCGPDDAMKIDCKPYCDYWTRSLRRLYPVRER